MFIPPLKPGPQDQVSDSWLCHKNNILAQRRKDAEKPIFFAGFAG